MKVFLAGVESSKRIKITLSFFAVLLVMIIMLSALYQRGESAAANDYSYDSPKQSPFVSSEDDSKEESSEELPEVREDGEGLNLLILGKDYDSYSTDVLICVSFDLERKTVSTLQIPRDTYISEGEYSGRINTLLPRYRAGAVQNGSENALHDGITALSGKIEKDFGIALDGYIFLDLNSLEAITDVLGGVTVDIPADIDYEDKERGIDLHLKAGLTHLDGKTAAQFLRYRQGYLQADIGRINAQKLFAAALINKIYSYGSISTLQQVVSALTPYVKTDLSAEDILYLATKLAMTEADSITLYTLPGNGIEKNGAYYFGVYKDGLYDIVARVFAHGRVINKDSLGIQDFSEFKGGYTDTEGMTLESIIKNGINIPVYKKK